MANQLAFIKTIQPYFVMGTSRFEQYVLGEYGISHFYNYEMDKEGADGGAVPDGCIDIFFTYGKNGLHAKVCGTVLEHKKIVNKFRETHFGVRFFPGVCPHIINSELKDLVDREVLLADVVKSPYLLERMSMATNFTTRINVFLEEYKKYFVIKESNNNMQTLFRAMEPIIYGTSGEVRIKDMEERTGYSSRYINKIFNAVLGMNPKTFCLIIKFQHFLTHLHSMKDEDLTKIALDYGYYDQAYLIKQFTKYTNMTPKKYYRLIQDVGYKDRLVNYTPRKTEDKLM